MCTTTRPVDDGIVEIARRCGAGCFRGSVEDKLDRWLGAARESALDAFITMDGDDLLCDPELIGLAIRQLESGGLDFLKAPRGLICGAFTYAIRRAALEKVCAIKGTSDTEMMWVYFEDTGLFKVGELEVPDKVFFGDRIRMTLDYPEDLEFFRRIFEGLRCPDNDVPLRRIVPFLQEHPEIVELNAFRQQEFLDNQKRRTKLVLKDPGVT